MNFSEVAIILGTRAEYIKMFPIMLELQKRKEDYYFIHTGQHNLQNLCKTFGTKKPDVILSPEPSESSKFDAKESKAIKWSIKTMFKIRKELKYLSSLKYVFYHGDTMSTGIAAISKLFNPFKKYQNVHLESGLRSFSKEPFPEEIIRRIVTRFSDILIAPSKLAKSNLKNRKNVYVLGNTILDSVDIASHMAKNRDLKPFDKKFALVVIHRHENISNKERLNKIVEILLSLEIPSYFTLHDNTKNQLVKFGLFDKLLENKNIKIIKPLDYISMIFQMSNCSLLICDGGSIQEESLILKKPCIILRMATERQEGLKSNFQYLSKLDVEKTKEKIKEYLSKDFKVEPFKNPYGKKGISKKIVEILK